MPTPHTKQSQTGLTKLTKSGLTKLSRHSVEPIRETAPMQRTGKCLSTVLAGWATVDELWPERVQSVCAAWSHLQKQKCILKMICQTFPPNPCMWRKKPPAPCDVWYNYFVNLPPGCCTWVTVQSSWSVEDNSNNTVTSWWVGTVAIDWLCALMWDPKKFLLFLWMI